MTEILLLVLIACMVTGLICYTAGYFSGKAIERKRIVEIIERYYEGGNHADLY